MKTSAPFNDLGQVPLDILGSHQAGDLTLGPIHAHGAVDPQGPMPVADDDVFVARHDQALGHAHARGPDAVDDNADIRKIFPHHLEGVVERGQDNDARGMEFMVQHRDPDGMAHPVLHREAFGRGDAFQADAAEGGGQHPHRFDDFIGILGFQGNRDGIHIGKGLEDDALGLQLGKHRGGADIAEFKDGAAVGDQGDGVPPAGVAEGGNGISVDFPADGADAGSIDSAHHRHVPDGHLALDADEAPVALAED